MRPSSPVSALAAAFVLLVLPAALPAQAAGSTPAASRPPGCRGTTSETSSVTMTRPNGPPVEFSTYPKLEEVQRGSPAERAGMRPGDKIILQDGHDVAVDPPARTYLAGDTVPFLVRRNDVEIPLTVVLGRWDPPQEAPGVTRICRPLDVPAGG